MDHKITLNFFPIHEDEFEFEVFCKNRNNNDIKEEGTRGYSLPKFLSSQINLEERQNFLISFNPKEGYEKVRVKSWYNNYLTTAYLYECLYESTKTSLNSKEFISDDSRFNQKIDYVLRQHSLGNELISLEPYYLSTAKKFGFLVNFHFRKNQESPFTREIQRLSLSLDSRYLSNKAFYQDKFSMFREFTNKYCSKLFPLRSGINVDRAFIELDLYELKAKKFIVGNKKETFSLFKGLTDYGPAKPASGVLHIPIIYSKGAAFAAEDLIKALSGTLTPFFGGFPKFFRSEVKFHFREIEDTSSEYIEPIIEKSIGFKTENKSLVPVILLDQKSEEPYYPLKLKFIQAGVPVQFITKQLIQNKNTFKWAVGNIALAIFCKAGGVPWELVPASNNALIFGIGQAHRKDEDGRIHRFFSYSICTDSSGLYKQISVLGSDDREASYLEQFSENLKTVISEKISANLKSIVLHVPFKLKKRELEQVTLVIEQVSKEYSRQDLEFIVLKINEDNKFFGFAETNSLVPYEGSFLAISKKEYLVWFEGLHHGKEVLNKMIGGPAHVEVHWSNKQLTNDDHDRMLQDLLNLSGGNWRGLNARSMPISIYYCKLVSRFLAHCGNVSDLGSSDVPWFL